MKHQALFSSKDKSKKLKCRLLQYLFGALRVNNLLAGELTSFRRQTIIKNRFASPENVHIYLMVHILYSGFNDEIPSLFADVEVLWKIERKVETTPYQR